MTIGSRLPIVSRGLICLIPHMSLYHSERRVHPRLTLQTKASNARLLLQRNISATVTRAPPAGDIVGPHPSSLPISRPRQCEQRRWWGMAALWYIGDGEVFPTQCVKQSGFPADIDAVYNTTEVETAVLALRDVTQRINRFYSNPRPSLGLDRLRLERFLASLEQRTNDLRDCIDINRINAALHWETSKALEKYFRKLDDIATEKDNSVCARNVIRIEVGRQLQSAARLATNIRKMHILQTSLSP
ncbi:interferon alpha-11-like isoform X2 [Ambystoma mexicanum]|uniref:interferon alpha-11-like isoform X2 n=1 Tax=Ambystoma mexicanum TaxID=8296 RepID=UPI0037E9860A